MGKLIYQFGIYLLQSFLKIHALFNQKSKLAVEGRNYLFPELKKAFYNRTTPVAWFHCASLGEFEQGRPLIEKFKQQYPDFFILLTFFSPSGYEVKKNYEYADHVTYMPLDTPAKADQFVQITKPKIAFFIKYEFWYFHLKALSDANCWIFSVSAIFRSEQLFFKFYGQFYRNILKEFDHFFVQNKSSEVLLKAISINNVSVTGDTRFDRVQQIVQSVQPSPIFNAFSKDAPLLIAGSSWEADVKAIAPFLQHNTSWKAIIAPHDISEQNLKLHENELKIKTVRFSEVKYEIPADVRVLLIDNVGMLSKLYQYGEVAFIGGAFGAGLHNTLEAACFGLPIFFGDKNYKKFQEANQLLEIGAAKTVSSAGDFKNQLESLLEKKQLKKMSEKALNFVQANLGATDKIISHISPIIQKMEK